MSEVSAEQMAKRDQGLPTLRGSEMDDSMTSMSDAPSDCFTDASEPEQRPGEAAKNTDVDVVMATTLVGAVLSLVSLLVRDILYAVVDPRVSYE